MQSIEEARERVIVLGNAEYRYDRLTSDFAEHYLALREAGYDTLPDIDILKQ